MEAQLQTALILGAVAIPHGLRPDLARRAILRDLFEEIVMRVEEETKPWREGIYRKPALDGPIDVFESVAQRERQLLHRRRSGFADVVTGD